MKKSSTKCTQNSSALKPIKTGVRRTICKDASPDSKRQKKDSQSMKSTMPESKVCTSCKEEKPFSGYYRHKSYIDGHKNQCKDCETKSARLRYELRRDAGDVSIKNNRETNRAGHLKRTFGITIDQYNELYEKQNGCCAICKKSQDTFNKRFAVDHAHTESEHVPAGMIRGLLCFNCNHLLIGKYTNAELFENAAKYLRQHSGWIVPEDKIKVRRRRKKKKVTK